MYISLGNVQNLILFTTYDVSDVWTNYRLLHQLFIITLLLEDFKISYDCKDQFRPDIEYLK